MGALAMAARAEPARASITADIVIVAAFIRGHSSNEFA